MVLAKFEKYVEKAIRAWNVPGLAIGIVKDNQLIYAKGFGVKQVGTQDAIDENTVFQIGSITKSFTSALIAQLVSEKKINWDDKVIDILPEFRLYDPWVTQEFTIEDLLCHRSGLPEGATDLLMLLGYSRQDMIKGLQYIEPCSSFRTKFAYQNAFYLVAGEIIKKLTDETWEVNLDKKLFKPLCMSHSSVSLTEYNLLQNKTRFHKQTAGKSKLIPLDWPHQNWVYTAGPAGAINSNIVDMSEWLKFQMNAGVVKEKKLIKESVFHAMHRPRIYAVDLAGVDGYYALGWMYSAYSPNPIIWHNGGTFGAMSFMGFVPRDKIGIIILVNTNGTLLQDALGSQFFDMFYQKQDRDWSVLFLKSQKNIVSKIRTKLNKLVKVNSCLSFKKYIGQYESDVLGFAKIYYKKGKLFIVMGEKSIEMQLKPCGRNVFYFYEREVLGELQGARIFFDFYDNKNLKEVVIKTKNHEVIGRLKKKDAAKEKVY